MQQNIKLMKKLTFNKNEYNLNKLLASIFSIILIMSVVVIYQNGDKDIMGGNGGNGGNSGNTNKIPTVQKTPTPTPTNNKPAPTKNIPIPTSNIPTLPTPTNNIPIKAINNTDTDIFGIQKIYPTTSGGREWYSKWNNGDSRSWKDNSDDPDDSEFITAHKGTGSWNTDGNGILTIAGSTPRMYVMDPKQKKNWHNVEITVYAKRESDNNIAYGGIQAYARTNHYIDSNLCDARGYGGRFKYDGIFDFEKETAHHEGGYVQEAIKNYWHSGMPYNEWIGYKFMVYDLPNGNVKLELWLDETDGFNGGNWVKVDEFTDNGTNFGVGINSCDINIDPAMKLTSSDQRSGSETGKPNLAVYFRSDGVNNEGLLYKKASIREIAPLIRLN